MSRNTDAAAGGSKADTSAGQAKSTAAESPKSLSQEKHFLLDGKPKKQAKLIVGLSNGEKKTIEFEDEIPSLLLGEFLKKVDKSIVQKENTKIKGFTKQVVSYLSGSEHGHDVSVAEAQDTPRGLGGPASEQGGVERILPLGTDNAPNTIASVSQVTAEDGKTITKEIKEIPKTFSVQKDK